MKLNWIKAGSFILSIFAISPIFAHSPALSPSIAHFKFHHENLHHCQIRELLHILFVRDAIYLHEHILATTQGLPTTYIQAISGRLLENSQQQEELCGKLFGSTAQTELATLLVNYQSSAERYIAAIAAGNFPLAQQTLSEWLAEVDPLIHFFKILNPKMDSQARQRILDARQAYVTAVANEAVAYSQHDLILGLQLFHESIVAATALANEVDESVIRHRPSHHQPLKLSENELSENVAISTVSIFN